MPTPRYVEIADTLSAHGLALRGGFHPAADEDFLDAGVGRVTRTVLLVGNTGPDLWPHFAPHAEGPNALDRWTVETVTPIAERVGARPVYPFDKPFQPFQRWAMRAEAVSPSPVGVLMHPDNGLWHAYRAALLFAETIDLPPADTRASPCATCSEKPCLSGCPVRAFSGDGYDVPACAAWLASPAGDACMEYGCRARDACPVAADRRYSPEQIRFHMRSFKRAVVG